MFCHNKTTKTKAVGLLGAAALALLSSTVFAAGAAPAYKIGRTQPVTSYVGGGYIEGGYVGGGHDLNRVMIDASAALHNQWMGWIGKFLETQGVQDAEKAWMGLIEESDEEYTEDDEIVFKTILYPMAVAKYWKAVATKSIRAGYIGGN